MNTPANIFQFPTTHQASSQDRIASTTNKRQPHRERDFGVGYGSSSGYASDRHYVTGATQRLFRCA